jgi:hypothetical protein
MRRQGCIPRGSKAGLSLFHLRAALIGAHTYEHLCVLRDNCHLFPKA